MQYRITVAYGRNPFESQANYTFKDGRTRAEAELSALERFTDDDTETEAADAYVQRVQARRSEFDSWRQVFRAR